MGHMNKTQDLTDRFAGLQAWIAHALDADDARITRLDKLSGGAIQENWSLDVCMKGGQQPGEQAWVLRTDALSTISSSLGRAEEFAILKVVERVGVTAPAPVLLCQNTNVIGTPFYLMSRKEGTAHAREITRDPNLSVFGEKLAVQLGTELGRLHRVTPQTADLPFLSIPDQAPTHSRINQYRDDLDALPDAHPVLEFALNWLEDNAPTPNPVALCHCDFRTGNYLVKDGILTAILDWEFASWGDPDEDIGWLCARSWRFGNDHLQVGGIASLEGFLKRYQTESQRTVSVSQIFYWQTMAELRWAVIALQQAQRCRSNIEITQELALTGLMASEMELNILNLIEGIEDAK